MDDVATHNPTLGSGLPDGKLFRPVETVLKPSSLAIVGASDKGESGWSQIIFDNLRDAGFPAKVFLVNPGRDKVWGETCYPDIASIGEPVEHALMMVPAKAVPGSLREGAENGLKSATIYSAGFGEGGGDADSKARGQALVDISNEFELRICGPNCMGGVAVHEGLSLYPSKRAHRLEPGSVGAVFQSGGTLQFWIEQAAARGLSFSYAVTTGNEIDLDLADFLNFYAEDPNTRVITCLVEGVRRPQALMAAARKAHAADKPILMVKIGRTEAAQEQAKSHTGAVAGDDAVFDAMCRRYGIVRCESLTDMVELALVFDQGRIPAGNRMGLVTTSGAVKGLALDAAGEVDQNWGQLSPATGERLAQLISSVQEIDNPLDCGPAAVANGFLYGDIVEAVAADDDVDMVAFLARTPLAETEPDRAEPFATLADRTDKPVIAFAHHARPTTSYGIEFQRSAGIPFIHGVPQAIRAMSALAGYSESKRRGIPEIPAPGADIGGIEDDQLKKLLNAAQAPAPREKLVSTATEAAQAAAEIGYPVALKLVATEAVHKTEIGGVEIELANGSAVTRAVNTMSSRLSGKISINGYLVQDMVEGLETIVGFREDPQFGPFVMVGLGGVYVEVLKDTAIRMLPATPDDIIQMTSRLRSAPLFGEFRGQPARDIEGFATAVSALGDLFLDLRPWFSDLEINPLIVGPVGHGVRAVDVRPVRRAPQT